MKKWMKYGAAAVMAAGMVLGGSMEALAAHLEDITRDDPRRDDRGLPSDVLQG